VPDGYRLRLAEFQADGAFDILTLRFQLGTTTFSDITVPRTIGTTPLTLVQDGVRLQVTCGAEGVNELLDTLQTAADTATHQAEAAVLDHFEPALCIMQDKHRVNSLIGDTLDSVTVDGAVYWEEGHNVRILLQPGPRRLRILAEPGAGAGHYCERREPARVGCDELLLAINELYADGYGRFQLVGGNGVTVTPEPTLHRLTIRANVAAEDIDCEANNG
jgi:hypothetical protein